ncbi:hypothetical protein C8Q75DRAFT_746529 [Abortiporus biennis]|nr:hypothetical protein C8Q75DRAFT_746529 [Abortiporus biennis]
MSEAPTQIAREAKGLKEGLKELLKDRDITDREIEIHRKNLRRQYLRLLLVYPYARESKDAESHLWMQTSYQLISIYKQRISSLDRQIINPNQQRQQNNQHQQRVVEHRKLLQRFRQFLSEEEKFYTQLIVRLRRNFAIEDAQSALTALSILPEDELQAANAATAEGNAPRRNQYQFPPESDMENPTLLPTTPAQRESRIAIVSKALVYLGDIARYKELYNEAGGRPRAGHEDGPPAQPAAGRSGRGGKRGGGPTPPIMMIARMRNYERAQACYEQARLLLPNDGNALNQLAIVAYHQKEVLNALVYYYRALCVRQPYETAAENLTTVLHRALEQWKSSGSQKQKEQEEKVAKEGGKLEPRHRVEFFVSKVIVLHAIWRFGEKDPGHVVEKLLQEFEGLVSERVIPDEMISKVIVLSEAALWKYRMVRQPSSGDRKTPRSSAVESQIATHLLQLHRILLNVGYGQLLEEPPEGAVDLAQLITAPFRRTLPALRMAGKWVRGNVRYISQARKYRDSDMNGDMNGHDGGSRGKEKRGGHRVVIEGVEEFWDEYVRFSNALQNAFPTDKLPAMVAPLEEDIEYLGFLPLKKFMLSDVKAPASTLGTPKENEAKTNGVAKHLPRDQVHPNEEQLMRIADILVDARAVADDEHSPLSLDGDAFILGSKEDALIQSPEHPASPVPPTPQLITTTLDVQSLEQHNKEMKQKPQADEDAMTEVSRTTDDPVSEVFRQVLNSDDDDDDEEDQIVWSLGSVNLSPRHLSIQPPVPTTPQHRSPISPRVTDTSPRRIEPISPFHLAETKRSPPAVAVKTTPAATTAQDLLNNVMSKQRPSPMTGHVRVASTPSAPFLFGSGGPSHSIWSTTGDSNSLKYPPPTTNTTSPPLNQISSLMGPSTLHDTSSLPISQSPWDLPALPVAPVYSSPPFNNSSQPATYGSLSTSGYPVGHQRITSESILSSRNQSAFMPVNVGSRHDIWDPRGDIIDQSIAPHVSRTVAPPAAYADALYSSTNSGYYRDDLQHQNNNGISPSQYRSQQTFTAGPYRSSSSIWGHPG